MGTYTTQDLENQLTRISNAVAACRTAIYNRGVNIPADAKLADLATYAAMIDCSHPDILLEYLENGTDDTAASDVYFDTGYSPGIQTSMEIRYKHTALRGDQCICGRREQDLGARQYIMYLYTNGNTPSGTNTSVKWWCRDKDITSPVTPVANTLYTVGVYSTNTSTSGYSALSMVVNGTTYTKNYTVTSPLTGTLSLYLFARNSSNGSGTRYVDKKCYGKTKIYYVKIWEDNNLVRFYVPVLHYINHQYVACFYDKVNDTYIYNIGSGDVTYASTGDYLLDYIGAQDETAIPVTSSTNIRYATGVAPDATIQVDTKFRLLWGGENYIYGSATDNTTTPTWQVFGIGYPGNNTKLRLNFGARSTAINTTDPGVDASTATTSSLFFGSSLGRCYLNGIKYNNGYQSTLFSNNGIDLFSRHGNSQNVPVRNGARIYYCTMSKGKAVQKTYVPVLHNDSPYFLDLNTGNYLSHDGSGTPTYSLLD